MNNRSLLSFTTIVLISLISMVISYQNVAWANSIVSWGDNSRSQVSDTPTGDNFTFIAAGWSHSLALRVDGSIVAWGADDSGVTSSTPGDNDFTAIAAGTYHSLALRTNGSIISWGDDRFGQVSDTPTGNDFIAIAAGDYHSLALRSDGSILAWGWDDYNQVSDTPIGNDFSSIAGGMYHSLAIKKDGSILDWGYNGGGVITNTPPGNNFSAIAAGGSISLALRDDGSLVSWGSDGSNFVSDAPTGNDFSAIAAGGSYGLALKVDGSIVSWGDDRFGQVSDTPTASTFVAITTGGKHSLALGSKPTISLLEPNGSERLNEGNDYKIKWSGDVSGSELLIEYSINNGADWNIITTIQDANSYDWQVSGPASKDCLVRVTVSDFPYNLISDTSDNTFLIYNCSEELTGDLNHDCQIDLRDIAIVAQNWLAQSCHIIYSFPLNSTENWTTEGQWLFGTPMGMGGSSHGYPDPNAAYTGQNVYGVNLNGDYTVAVGGPYCLTAGPFNCSQFYDMKLKFARWLNTDDPNYVTSKVEASNDGTNWDTVWENTASVTDSDWQVVEYDVSETADNEATVYFRWSYEILDDRAYPYSGWNIDDVELRGLPN